MEIIGRLILVIFRIFAFLLTPGLLLFLRRHKKLPPIKPEANDILLTSATNLTINIKSRKIKCLDVVTAYINRIKDVNPIINAVVDERFNDAIEEAKHVDELVNVLSEEVLWNNYPLLGVPVTIKGAISVKDLLHVCGDYHRVEIKATTDALVVQRLKDAGAIIICVTNTPEWSAGWETENPVFGRTVNPYNNRKTVGGSSGGEAALIASAGSVVGIASDMASSIRIPASFTGVFGHKPTPKLTSLNGWHPVIEDENFEFYHAYGTLTRYAKDLPLMINIILGPKAVHLNLDESVDISKLKIFYMHRYGWHIMLRNPAKYVINTVKKAVNHFSDIGCHVEKMSIEQMSDVFEICCSKLFHMEGVPVFLAKSDTHDQPKNLLWEWIKCITWTSKHSYNGLSFCLLYKFKNIILPRRKIEKYDKVLVQIEQHLLNALKDNGVLIVPVFHSHAFYHYKLPGNLSGVKYGAIFNLLGFPATSVPIGMHNGLPVGIQVVAAPYQDRLCFAVARELEKAFGGWVLPNE